MPRALCVLAIVSAALALTGCGIPVDPDGTLERIDADRTLRAGASPSGELLRVTADDVAGPLVDLIEGFARTRGAEVTWEVESEESLVDGLESGALDLAVGGMTDRTPWSDRVSVTRGFTGIHGAEDTPVVFLLPMGENATQSALERYLDDELAR